MDAKPLSAGPRFGMIWVGCFCFLLTWKCTKTITSINDLSKFTSINCSYRNFQFQSSKLFELPAGGINRLRLHHINQWLRKTTNAVIIIDRLKELLSQRRRVHCNSVTHDVISSSEPLPMTHLPVCLDWWVTLRTPALMGGPKCMQMIFVHEVVTGLPAFFWCFLFFAFWLITQNPV